MEIPHNLNTYIFAIITIFSLICTSVLSNQIDPDSGPLTCYECNVWKAGYGNLCEKPRIRSGCFACMKFETTIFMGYYKNTPRYSTVISRACVKTKVYPHNTGCYYFDTVDGHNERCYCNYSMCNGIERKTASMSILSLLASSAVILAMKNLYL